MELTTIKTPLYPSKCLLKAASATFYIGITHGTHFQSDLSPPVVPGCNAFDFPLLSVLSTASTFYQSPAAHQ
jgi:hypothetical protein